MRIKHHLSVFWFFLFLPKTWLKTTGKSRWWEARCVVALREPWTGQFKTEGDKALFADRLASTVQVIREQRKRGTKPEQN